MEEKELENILSEPPKRRQGFQKGVSGNPHGRPKKGNSFGDILEKELKRIKKEIQLDDDTTRNINGKEILSMALVQLAMNGKDDNIKLKAIEKIMDRIDGRPKEVIEGSINNVVTARKIEREEFLSSLSPDEIDELDDVYKKLEKNNQEN